MRLVRIGVALCSTAGVLLAYATDAYASLRVGVNPDIQAAQTQAAADIRVAWILGSAVVIAGIAIGLGLYFGLRGHRVRNESPTQEDGRSS